MDDSTFEDHLPEDLRKVAEALVTGREVADGHLLERVQRRVQARPSGTRHRLASPSPRRITAVVLAVIFGLNVSGALATVLSTAGLGTTSLTNLNVTQVLKTVTSPVSYGRNSLSAADEVYCPDGTKANFRWHYSGQNSNGSFTSGSWSGTQGVTCPDDDLSMGPQAMEGDLKLAPGTTLKVGYDLTVPGLSSPVNVTVTNPKVTFTNVHCASGATPTQSSFTVTMPNATYNVTTTAWYPSGDQSSPLVYQGSILVPNLCPGGTDHRVRLDKGGTFTASVS
jgi:hypothetical protein